MAYDGSINIDTRVDTKGMTKGTKSIASSLSGVLRSIKGVGAALGLAFSGAAIFRFVKTTLESFDLMSSGAGKSISALKTSFDAFKGAVANSVMAAFQALAPYIITFVNWLTKMLTILTAVISVLFGVQNAMNGLGKATDNTGKKSKKAAGALAAFDQINVLAKKEEDNDGGGGGGLLPNLPDLDGFAEKVQAFKEKMLEFLKPATDALLRLYDALKPLGENIWRGLKWAWDNILVPLGSWVMTEALPAFLDLLGGAADVVSAALEALAPLWMEFWNNTLKPLAEWAGDKFIEFLEWLTVKLHELADWMRENPEKFQTFVIILGALAVVFLAIYSVILLLLSPLGLIGVLIAAIAVLVVLLVTQWEKLGVTISQIVFLAGNLLSGWANMLKSAFFAVLDAIKGKFQTIFDGIKLFVKGVINGIIGFINGMISGIVTGINAVVNAANAVGGAMPGYQPLPSVEAPQIPRLATGAVIPANAEFAAILGDQKSGRNIEAPEGLIRQIVSEEMGKIEANIKIEFGGSLSGLVRELKPYIDKEAVRVGGSLIKSGVVV